MSQTPTKRVMIKREGLAPEFEGTHVSLEEGRKAFMEAACAEIERQSKMYQNELETNMETEINNLLL